MKLLLGGGHKNSLIVIQHCFRQWPGAVRQQAIICANVDPNLSSYVVTRPPRVKHWWFFFMGVKFTHMANGWFPVAWDFDTGKWCPEKIYTIKVSNTKQIFNIRCTQIFYSECCQVQSCPSWSLLPWFKILTLIITGQLTPHQSQYISYITFTPVVNFCANVTSYFFQ